MKGHVPAKIPISTLLLISVVSREILVEDDLPPHKEQETYFVGDEG